MSSEGGKNAIILSDLRAVPVAAALDIWLREKGGDFFIARASIRHRDFGDTVSLPQKWAVVLMLKIVGRLTVVPTVRQNSERNLYHGFMSSLISITNSRLADESEHPTLARELRQLEDGALSVYEQIKSRGYEQVFLFNGRTASTQPIAKELSRNGAAKIMIYEWGGQARRTYLKVPHPRHDMVAEGKRIMAWASARNYTYDVGEAESYKRLKLANAFALSPNENLVGKYNTVIFSGSPHEHAVVDVPNLSGLDGDVMGLVNRAIASGEAIPPIALRMHPNMTKDPSLRRQLDHLSQMLDPQGVDIIPPANRVSAIDLIREAKVVIVGNSTVGLDSIFYDKWPVIVGHPPYKDLAETVKKSFPDDYSLRLAGLLARYTDEHVETFGVTANFVWMTLRLFEVTHRGLPGRSRLSHHAS